jgi:predicted transcriptional regulator
VGSSSMSQHSNDLQQLEHRVLLQVRSSNWKQRSILKRLRTDQASSINQLSAATKLDLVNVSNTLAELEAAGKVTPCARNGGPIRNVDKKTYWRIS